MTVVLVRRLAGSCERLLVEPARDIDRFFLGIDQAGTEQPGRIDLAMHHAFDPRAGVEPPSRASNTAILLTKSHLVINSRSASATCFTASY